MAIRRVNKSDCVGINRLSVTVAQITETRPTPEKIIYFRSFANKERTKSAIGLLPATTRLTYEKGVELAFWQNSTVADLVDLEEILHRYLLSCQEGTGLINQ